MKEIHLLSHLHPMPNHYNAHLSTCFLLQHVTKEFLKKGLFMTAVLLDSKPCKPLGGKISEYIYPSSVAFGTQSFI